MPRYICDSLKCQKSFLWFLQVGFSRNFSKNILLSNKEKNWFNNRLLWVWYQTGTFFFFNFQNVEIFTRISCCEFDENKFFWDDYFLKLPAATFVLYFSKTNCNFYLIRNVRHCSNKYHAYPFRFKHESYIRKEIFLFKKTFILVSSKYQIESWELKLSARLKALLVHWEMKRINCSVLFVTKYSVLLSIKWMVL